MPSVSVSCVRMATSVADPGGATINRARRQSGATLWAERALVGSDGRTTPMSAHGQPPGSEINVDVSERGAREQRSNRRLFMQLQAFGGCVEPKPLVSVLEASRLDAVLYA